MGADHQPDLCRTVDNSQYMFAARVRKGESFITHSRKGGVRMGNIIDRSEAKVTSSLQVENFAIAFCRFVRYNAR